MIIINFQICMQFHDFAGFEEYLMQKSELLDVSGHYFLIN